jgi:biotin synthase-related radical SAM superfamily protein
MVERGCDKKAALIADGQLFVSSELDLPYPFCLSSAGPIIRTKSLVFRFDKHRIKMEITRHNNVQFHLIQAAKKFSIYRNGRKYIDYVEILPARFHAPNQVFLNLESRCIFNCLFCEQRKNPLHINNYLDSKKIYSYLKKALEYPSIESVAFTSGIYPDNESIIRKFCRVINQVKKINDELPIGVEPLIYDYQEIDELKRAGADEIKINLQIPDKEIFKKFCPDINQSHILNMLDYAVDIFGEGKVCSNILFGLGESDTSIINAIEDLVSRGVTPSLRKVRYNQQINRNGMEELEKKTYNITKERIVNLGYKQKQILSKNNLTPKSFDTMCHKCYCCDLVPFIDF